MPSVSGRVAAQKSSCSQCPLRPLPVAARAAMSDLLRMVAVEEEVEGQGLDDEDEAVDASLPKEEPAEEHAQALE